MDFCDVMPRASHPHLLWLGRVGDGWVSCEDYDLDGPGTRFLIRDRVLETAPGAAEYLPPVRHLIDGATRIDSGAGGVVVCWLEACGAALALGPRVFHPSEEAFESMEQVELHVPISAYRQPYPVLLVRVPPGARRRTELEHGIPVNGSPRWVLCRRRDDWIFLGQRFPYDSADQTHMLRDRAAHEDLESALTREASYGDKDPKAAAVANTFARAAMNLCMLLVHRGFRDAGPVDPVAYERHRKKPELRKYAAADVRKVVLDQEVTVRRVLDVRQAGDGEPSGREMPTHWRRGHYRQQACGIGRVDRKTVFIAPVLVRGDRGLSPESVTYKVK